MSQLIPVRDFSAATNPAAAMRAAHKERMRRMAAAACVPPPAVPAPEPEPVPLSLDQIMAQYVCVVSQEESDYGRAIRIRREVAEEHGVTLADLKCSLRGASLAEIRQTAIWEVARQTKLSTVVIGKLFNREHTTVIYAIRSVNQRRGENVRNMGTAEHKRQQTLDWCRAKRFARQSGEARQ